MRPARFARPVRTTHVVAISVARVLTIALLAVCMVLTLGWVAVFVAPRATEPLTRLPHVYEALFAFFLLAPMLIGIPIAWGLLALGRGIFRQHRILAWPVGVVAFTAIMDVLPARVWLDNVPGGDRVPGLPDPSLLERMGDFFGLALASGMVVATLWWLLLGARAYRPQ